MANTPDDVKGQQSMTTQDASEALVSDLILTVLDGEDLAVVTDARVVYGMQICGDGQYVVRLGGRYWFVSAVNEVLAGHDSLEDALSWITAQGDDPFCVMEGLESIDCDGMSAQGIAGRLSWLNEPEGDLAFLINGEPWQYDADQRAFSRRPASDRDADLAWNASRRGVAQAKRELARAQQQLASAKEQVRVTASARRRLRRASVSQG